MERNLFSDITGVEFSYGIDLSYIYKSVGDDVYVTPYISIRRAFGTIVLDAEIATPVEVQDLNPLWKIAFTVFYVP